MQEMLRSVPLSVCLSVPCLYLNNGAFQGYGYYRTLIGNPVLVVEPTGQRGHGSSRNGNEAVARAASEAFARWLLRRYRPVKLRGLIVTPRDILSVLPWSTFTL